jgi:hypothetical protein
MQSKEGVTGGFKPYGIVGWSERFETLVCVHRRQTIKPAWAASEIVPDGKGTCIYPTLETASTKAGLLRKL